MTGPRLTFYHCPQTRSSVVHWMLEELGQPYDLKRLDLKKGEHQQPDYLAINPMGKVPAIVHGGVTITEVAAICTYLADEFPQAKLNIATGDPRRGVYLKWLFFAPSIIEPAMMDRAFPRKEPPPAGAIGYRDLDAVLDILAKGIKGPWLMGEQFTAADLVIGALLRYGTMFKLIPERDDLKAYIAGVGERPALARANEKDMAAMAAGKA